MDNNSLVKSVVKQESILKLKSLDGKVLEAMRRVDRKQFIPEITDPSLRQLVQQRISSDNFGLRMFLGLTEYTVEESPYLDMALPIGYGQTCSQPSVVALMTDLLELQPGMKVLEVGTGCGYQTAILSELVGPTGHIFSIEYITALVDLARQNLRRHSGNEFEQKITLIHGDGSVGYPSRAPYDRILFTAGVNSNGQFDSVVLCQQVPEGIMVYPHHIGPLVQERYTKGQLQGRAELGEMMFVSLKKRDSP